MRISFLLSTWFLWLSANSLLFAKALTAGVGSTAIGSTGSAAVVNATGAAIESAAGAGAMNAVLAVLPAALLFLAANLFNLFPQRKYQNKRLLLLSHGLVRLQAMLASGALSIVYHLALLIVLVQTNAPAAAAQTPNGWLALFLSPILAPDGWKTLLLSALVSFLAHFFVFWNGMISVYVTSVQLGVRNRVLGALFGWIPVVNFFALLQILRTVREEIRFETEKNRLDKAREGDAICRTKYPLLLVHGVFFRDYKHVNYWGRIPEALRRNGAVIYYGNHQSARAVADSASELAARIRQIVSETGCGKVNIIAHSKGGLDCRYAVDKCGIVPYVASLTTINTPHRGCEFADYLLGKLPKKMQEQVASAYNAAMRKLGDENPDFMAAVTDLTAEACRARNEALAASEEQFFGIRVQDATQGGQTDTSGNVTAAEPENVAVTPETTVPAPIYAQSIGSRLNRALNGKFPLNFTYELSKYFEGANDGLVAESSFPWGLRYRLITVSGRRGVSHGDVVDLNRENIRDFDVREFYVQLVSELRAMGL